MQAPTFVGEEQLDELFARAGGELPCQSMGVQPRALLKRLAAKRHRARRQAALKYLRRPPRLLLVRFGNLVNRLGGLFALGQKRHRAA